MSSGHEFAGVKLAHVRFGAQRWPVRYPPTPQSHDCAPATLACTAAAGCSQIRAPASAVGAMSNQIRALGGNHAQIDSRRFDRAGGRQRLLHRRALLGRGLAGAGTAGIASSLSTSAAAEPLGESPWSLEPGDPVPACQQPSKFANNVVRTLANSPRPSRRKAPSFAGEMLSLA